MNPRSIFRHVKAALDSEDIEGLLALGYPADEYNGEASLIEDRIDKATNFGEKPLDANHIEQIIAEVWNAEFGPFKAADLNKRRPAFSSIARKIANHP